MGDQEVVVTERQSSIEVTQNAKGDYALKVKSYFDDERTSYDDVIKKIEEAFTILHKTFK